MKQSNLDLLTVFLAETIATGLLVFIGCMGCVSGEHFVPTHLTICLTFGLAVMLSINIFGMVSGGHLNPAVTLAAYIYKTVNITTAIVYMVGQLLGGYLGYGLLRVLLNDYGTVAENKSSFCVSAPTVSGVPGFFIEFIITAILILVVCGVWDPRNAKHHDSVPLRFGLTVTVLALIGGPYSGGSMNPARSFGPALYNWNWEYQWIYWVAPMSAAAITAFAFRMIFYREPVRVERAGEETPLQETKNHV